MMKKESANDAVKKALILVVDDDEDFRDLVCQFLGKMGYQSCEAEDGQEAVRMFQENDLQLILMDGDMPVLDGFEACRRIKSFPEGKDIPILILTAYQDEDSVNRGFDAGATDYVTKPIHWAVLRRRIDNIITSFDNKKILQQARAEKKQAEEKLNHARKMEAIGLMAGGIAHDLNNILTGIVGYLELLLMNLPEESSMRRPLEAIHRSGLHAADVVADLLTVAQGVAAAKEKLDLNSLILDCLSSPEHQEMIEEHGNIGCTTNLNQEIKTVFCSPVHIKKCLMNLLLNGAEAVGTDGAILYKKNNGETQNRSWPGRSLEHCQRAWRPYSGGEFV